MSDFQLTEEQLAVISFVQGALNEHDIVHIKGAAGTGKTTILEEIANRAKYDCIFLTAPTNKAAKVIAEKTHRPAVTIHSLLKLVLHDEEDKQILKLAGDVDFDEEKSVFIVVDEASMMNKELMELAKRIQHAHGRTKFLFVGDPYQLNPINEELSTAFDCPGIELTTVMRQALDNPIIQLAYEYRNGQLKPEKKIVTSSYIDNERVFQHRSFSSFMNKYLEEYESGVETHLVAWRNARVDMLNNYVRKKLHGTDAEEPFLLGEEVMLYSPYQEFQNNSLVTLLHNSTLATVVDVDYKTQTVQEVTIPAIILTLEVDGETYQLVTPKSQPDVDDYLASIVKLAQSKEDPRERTEVFKKYFYPVKNMFTTVKPAHAMTSHKSQGSTWESVFVDIADINANRRPVERNKSIYVAVTRAAQRLHLFGR